MKNIIAFFLFVPIASVISWGVEELLDYLNHEYLWNMSDSVMRWISIIISCGIALPSANYLSVKIKQLRK